MCHLERLTFAIIQAKALTVLYAPLWLSYIWAISDLMQNGRGGCRERHRECAPQRHAAPFKTRPESGLDCLISVLGCLVSGTDCLISGLDCRIALTVLYPTCAIADLMQNGRGSCGQRRERYRTHTHTQTQTQTHRHTCTQIHRHPDTHAHRYTATHAHIHTNTQTHRQVPFRT